MARTTGSSGLKTREAIRKAGLRLIYQHGYEAFSLRQLAGEVGLQQGSLYNHIETKYSFLVDLIREHLTQLLTDLGTHLDGIQNPKEAMKTFIEFHLRYHMTRKEVVAVVNLELRSLTTKDYKAIVKLRDKYEYHLRDILYQGMTKGVFRRIDIAVTASAIISMLTGMTNWYQPEGRLDDDKLINIYTDLVMQAVCA